MHGWANQHRARNCNSHITPQKVFEARGLLFVATQRTKMTKDRLRTEVGIGINGQITDSSPLPIPDRQSKMLQGWVWGFLSILNAELRHDENRLKQSKKL
jgi:hypothetical protein